MNKAGSSCVSKRQAHRSQLGFTLIEVMVAVAVLAVVAVAASRVSGNYLLALETFKTRTLAQFVAHNQIADLYINPNIKDTPNGVGLIDGFRVDEQGQIWQINWQTEQNGLNLRSNTLAMRLQVAPVPQETAIIDRVVIVEPTSDNSLTYAAPF